MSSAQPTTVKTEEAAAVGSNPAAVKRELKCPLSDRHIHGEDMRKVWKECQEESFWYRALPLSLGSMAVTGGLIYNGIWKSSMRFGPFPKLAVAGILGYAVGKASYVRTCRGKFLELDLADRPGRGPGSWGGPFNKHGHGHRSCHHVCEECKKTPKAAPTEEVKS
ncbi:OCIA domain-containing protein 2 [Platichthys flesus]|uniref:OCIA domain-containing protein 2 n=1 Tax=Platichthys flesus TaxID=8260 RepID=UPI002DB9D06F|nr:OCIA domain-containing protein 2 [Platichthys flesus]